MAVLVALVLPAPGSSVAGAQGPVPVLRIGDVWSYEGDHGVATVQIPITLDRPAPVPLEVTITDTGYGDATPGVDYRLRNRKVRFPAGAVQAAARIDVLGDLEPEPTQEFAIFWIAVSEAAVVGRAEAVLTIADDDEVGGAKPTLAVGWVRIVESDADVTARIPWVLSEPLAQDLAVYLAPRFPEPQVDPMLRDASFDDFVAKPRIVWIRAGQTSGHFGVVIRGDLEIEIDERVLFDVQVWGDPTVTVLARWASVLIMDNDAGLPSAVRDLVAEPFTDDRLGDVLLSWTPPEHGVAPGMAFLAVVEVSRDGGAFVSLGRWVLANQASVHCGPPGARCVFRVWIATTTGEGPPVEVEVVIPDPPPDPGLLGAGEEISSPQGWGPAMPPEGAADLPPAEPTEPEGEDPPAGGGEGRMPQ